SDGGNSGLTNHFGFRQWLMLMYLFAQPWFTRSWGLQEVVLAKEVTVMYGATVSSFDSIAEFWDLATRRDVPPALKYGLIPEIKTRIENSNQLNVFRILRNRRER